MDIVNFTPLPALAGGVLIGLAATLVLVANGRVTGISGIVGGLLGPVAPDWSWRLAFLAGLVGSGVVIGLIWPAAFAMDIQRSPVALLAAGLLVGVGTRMGNGCTSGHGVCGLSRLSGRSAVAVGTFMLTGALMAALVTQVFGGAV